MAPIAKDNETVIAPAGVPTAANPAQKTLTDAARSQPVALEIPVTVNGARTMEGSDKREPFSESTQTVLVFTNGAVLRLASALASGQLVFLTNEKTKKEVVCQVVKSKNYRTVTGYVELEFTEPAPGFWGMRFPAAAAGPAPTAPAPVAPRPVSASVAPSAPAASKVVPPAAPVAVKPISPLPPPPVAVVPGVPVAVAPVAPAAIVIPAPPQYPEPHPGPISPIAKHEPSHAASNDYTKEIAAIFSVPQAPAEPKTPAQASAHVLPVAPPPAPVVPAIAAVPGIAAPSKSSSTDDLKQQAARLQEQLSAMLFTETSPKPTVPLAPSKEDSVKADLAAQKVLHLTETDLAPTSTLATPAPPTPLSIAKVAPPVAKPIKSSLDSEEVQIPAWLAPLARNAEAPAPESSAKSDAQTLVDSAVASLQISGVPETASAEDTTYRDQPTMFGGQLLADSSAIPVESSSTSSKKGLFLGLAAAAILVVVGAAWYSKQPSNLLTGSSSAKQVAAQSSNVEPVPTLGTPENAEPNAMAAKSSMAPTSVAASQPFAGASSPASMPASLATKNNVPAAHTVAPVEQPKKPTLGDVRLATPVVNHSAGTQESFEAEPSMLTSQIAAADSLGGLASDRAKGPAAPVPVGGDVKQARLIKSVSPIYPALARSQHISGNVQIDALIDAQGNVTTMKVLSGSPMLHQAALTAVKQWKYSPAMLDGNPTSMHLTVTVQFRAQ